MGWLEEVSRGLVPPTDGAQGFARPKGTGAFWPMPNVLVNKFPTRNPITLADGPEDSTMLSR